MRKVLEDLIFIGSIKETIDLFGKKWTLETLNSDQQLEVMTITGNYDTLTRIYAIKNEILARSLKQIDDIPLVDYKETLEFINKLQSPVVNKLYENYEKLVAKQNESLKELDEVKN
jgi:DNA-binding HxlR family transcriptional regulator